MYAAPSLECCAGTRVAGAIPARGGVSDLSSISCMISWVWGGVGRVACGWAGLTTC